MSVKRKKTKVVAFKLDLDVLRRLDEIAWEVGRSRSDLIREAILALIREYNKYMRVRGDRM